MLLGNVYLFLYARVTDEVVDNAGAGQNCSHYSNPQIRGTERHIGQTGFGVFGRDEQHKLPKRYSNSANPHDQTENVNHAFHVEPPALVLRNNEGLYRPLRIVSAT
jgi:hypothetical protein